MEGDEILLMVRILGTWDLMYLHPESFRGRSSQLKSGSFQSSKHQRRDLNKG